LWNGLFGVAFNLEIDQLFNSSEKRLARTLLLLARYGEHDKPARKSRAPAAS